MTLILVIGVVFAAWTPLVGGFIVAWNVAANRLAERRAHRSAPPQPEMEPVTDVMRNVHRLQPCAACPTRMAVPGTLLCTMCGAGSIDALPALIPAALPADDDWAKLR